MKATTKSIAYGMTTGIVVSTMFRSIPALAHLPETINCTTQLGDPMYFIMNVGIRLHGSLALVPPAVSHLVCRGTAWHAILTLGLAALALAS